MSQYLLLVLSILSFSINGFGRGLSARRGSGQHYTRHFSIDAVLARTSMTPEEMETGFEQLDISHAPEITDGTQLQGMFAFVRDTRFIDATTVFPRRLTWLFPDDGCFARAELMSQLLQEKGYPAPMKIFAFGDLEVKTKNAPGGLVTWWYHVTVAYRYGGQLIVFDPAIDPTRPLNLQEWGDRMGLSHNSIQFALCSPQTFDPDSDCLRPTALSRENALQEEEVFLGPEWDRVQLLGRDPQQELGEHPPWLNP